MIEAEIQKSIVDFLKAKGYLVFRMNSGYIRKNVKLSPPGTPDLLVIMRDGKVLWIEVKTETGVCNENQNKMIVKLRSMGQKIIIARCIDDVYYILEMLK